jgi:hypothetical protein
LDVSIGDTLVYASAPLSDRLPIGPLCTKSIDRYFRTIEHSPSLWLNVNIEF